VRRGALLWPYLGLSALLVASPALGDEGLPGALVVTRDANATSCPDQQELARRVLSLGVRQPGPPPEPLLVEVAFRREGSAYAATVRASGGKQGLRELAKLGESCAELAEDTSVVVAVLFDLLPPAIPPVPVPVTPLAETPERQPGAGERALPPAPRPPASTSASTSSHPFSMALGAHAGVGYGLVGALASASFGAAIRPRLGPWEASAGILWVPVRDVSYETQVIEVSLLSGRVGACLWLTDVRSALGWAGCVGMLFGVLRGQGQGFGTDLPASDFWFAGEAAVNGRFRIAHPWAIRWGLSLLVPRPHTFSVEGEGVVVESPPVAGLLEAGVELQFQ